MLFVLGVGAIVATAPDFGGVALSAAESSGAGSKGEMIAKGSDCFSCHAVDQKVVGPAFQEVAKKFSGNDKAMDVLSEAIAKGHVGTWGNIPMPAHPQLASDEIKEIVSWILGLKSGSSTSPATPAGETKTYTYTVDGKTVTIDFPIFEPGSTTKVTKTVFHGYAAYNSYCFRCHGEDAIGSSYAPNLRQSLNNGMTESEFTNVAMVGRKDKGMPSWAGFFEPDEIHEIYAYVKARAVGALGTGTPEN